MRKAVQKSWSLNFGKCRDPNRCLVVTGFALAEPRLSERVILEVGQGGEEKGGPSLGVQGEGICSSTGAARGPLSQHRLDGATPPGSFFPRDQPWEHRPRPEGL